MRVLTDPADPGQITLMVGRGRLVLLDGICGCEFLPKFPNYTLLLFSKADRFGFYRKLLLQMGCGSGSQFL